MLALSEQVVVSKALGQITPYRFFANVYSSARLLTVSDSPFLRRVSFSPSRYPSLSCRSIPVSGLLKQEWDYQKDDGQVEPTHKNEGMQKTIKINTL